MSRATIITIMVLLCILLIVGFFAWRSYTTSQSDVPVQSPAAQALLAPSASTTFTDFNGNPANLQRYEDKVIVAHSWASWVPTSDRSLRELSALQRKYENEIVVIAINRAERERTARQFLEAVQVTNLQLVADPSDSFFSSIDGQAMPETVFYDTAGNIVHHEQGNITPAELERYVTFALRASGQTGQE